MHEHFILIRLLEVIFAKTVDYREPGVNLRRYMKETFLKRQINSLQMAIMLKAVQI